MRQNRQTSLRITLIAALILFLFSGCVAMNKNPDSATETIKSSSSNDPYYPTNFSDFEVPGELRLERKNTLLINTSSFNGGMINLSGKVEVGSLTDFFVNSMQKNGWKINGEIRYENVLLAFTKPNKNCLITIYEGEFGARTQVYVYITDSVLANPY